MIMLAFKFTGLSSNIIMLFLLFNMFSIFYYMVFAYTYCPIIILPDEFIFIKWFWFIQNEDFPFISCAVLLRDWSLLREIKQRSCSWSPFMESNRKFFEFDFRFCAEKLFLLILWSLNMVLFFLLKRQDESKLLLRSQSIDPLLRLKTKWYFILFVQFTKVNCNIY